MQVQIPSSFRLGRIVATGAAASIIKPWEIHRALKRHASKDWGDVCSEDAAANDAAVERGGRLLSVYTSRTGDAFWIITEADRSATTVLLPEDY